MTIHTIHGPITQYGLADDCPRCQEHAANPLEGLDASNIGRLFAGKDLFTDLDRIAALNIRNEYNHAVDVIKRLGGRVS